MMMDVIDIIMMVLMLLYLSCTIQPMYGFSTSSSLLPSSLLHSSAIDSPLSSSTSTSTSVEDAVLQQLGYLPNNFVRVSAWKTTNKNATTDDTSMIPVAIQTYPLNGGAKRRQAKSKLVQQPSPSSSSSSLPSQSIVQSPFPTLFWLTCPDISKAIADLEGRGYVKILENELNLKPCLVNQLLCCHEEYAQLRWQSLTEEDRNILMTPSSSSSNSSSSSSLNPSLQRMRNIMELSGISGTNFTDWRYRDNDQHHHNDVTSLQNNDDNSGHNNNDQQKSSKKSSDTDIHVLKVPPIKCLHAHYAHYRSTIDTIMDDDDSDSDSTITTVRTINPVGEMIHKQLAKDFPDLVL
jgi:hypothetical protein